MTDEPPKIGLGKPGRAQDVQDGGEIDWQVYRSIDDIEPSVWNNLVSGRSVTFTHAFWQVLEKSGLNDFEYRYVVFREDGQPVAAATCYVVTTDVAIFSPPWMRRALNVVRRIHRNFLRFRLLECGTPIILNGPPFSIRPEADGPRLLYALQRATADLAREEGAVIEVLRDFETKDHPLLRSLNVLGYHAVRGLPNTWLDIRWSSLDSYHAAMKSYYRSKARKHLRRNTEKGIHYDRTTEFAELADELCRQWHVVHEHAAEFEREVLTPAFYRELAARCPQEALVLRFYRHTDWVGHALLLRDGDDLRWLYFGRVEATNDDLYLYVTQAVIETAIDLGAKRLEMGLTTYPIKQDAGARIEPLDFAIRSRFRLLNPLLGPAYRLLNKPPSPRDKAVFKEIRPESSTKI